MTYTLKPATMVDGVTLHCNLSLADREELKSQQGEPLGSILFGIMDSDRPVSIFDKHGTLAAIAGVVPQVKTVDHRVGAPWMLTTGASRTEPRAFIRQASEWITEQLLWYPTLRHKVYRHNKGHIKLLKLLGFTVEEPTDRSQLFLPFSLCVLR